MTVTENNSIDRLTDALQERAVAGCPVSFWLRDDDAVEPSESLDRLLQLTAKYSVPLTLAVIPAHTGNALAQRLNTTEHVSVAVHGWSHTNYANANEKKQELGNHRPQSDILAELARGLSKLSKLHHDRFVPLLVPPWNRVSAEIVEHLSEIDYRGVSTFGDENSAGVMSINTQVDIIDWKGTRGGRAFADLASQIVTHVQNGRSSIGILSHHLVHDETAWQFLEQLFAKTSTTTTNTTSGYPVAHWLPISELLFR